MTSHEHDNDPVQNAPGTETNNSRAARPDTAVPDGGIRSKLTDAQKAMLARKSGGGGGAGWQSPGGGHKPTRESGNQAKTQKKVRW